MSKAAKIFLSISIILLVAIIILLIVFLSNPYDVSNFKSIEVSDALEFFEDDDVHIFYIGYASCSACKDVIASLEKAQIKYEYMTNYLDLKSIDFESEDWQNLKEKLDKEVTVKVNGESITDTFGNILNDYGITPTVIITENKKQKGGFIGAYEEQEILDWTEYVLNNYEE